MARKSFEDCRSENERSRFRDPDCVLNRAALGRKMPTFYIAEPHLCRLEAWFKDADRLSKVLWDFSHFRIHPARQESEDGADFHLISVLNRKDFLKCQFLPRRKGNKPYLCYLRLNLDQRRYLAKLPFFRRSDIVFFTFDLGDCVVSSDDGMIVSGVTFAAPYEYVGEKRTIAAENQYRISFKGNCNQYGWFGSSYVRKQLKSLATPESQRRLGYLFADTSDPDVDRSKGEYMRILRNSTFALAPHGDGRWSFRFVEAIGAGAIPVIVSDCLTLPYEQLIDYNQFCIWIEEEQVARAQSMDEILALLPTDPQVIVGMMEKVELVNETCFKTPAQRIDSLLLSAREHRLANGLEVGRVHDRRAE